MTAKKTQEKSHAPVGDDQPANVKNALSDVVGIMAQQVRLIRQKAMTERLEWGDARLLAMYSRALVAISNEEHRTASGTVNDLGHLSNEDLDRLAEEAERAINGGRK